MAALLEAGCPRPDEALAVNVKRLIREMWPMRHDFFGVRLMLRSIVRMERKLRDYE